MALSVGIVGLPNVGKSTLFTALTKQTVDAANYPFCTIEPNVGVVAVPDERIDQLAAAAQSAKVLPTVIEFVDIAGLVAGASKGEGLGNKFLENIRQVDAIAHVVRHFTEGDITHVDGRVDPTADITTIHTELLLADVEVVEKRLADLERKLKSSADKEAAAQKVVLEKIRQHLLAEKLISSLELTDEERALVKQYNFLTSKPMLFVVNVDEGNAAQDITLPGIAPEQTVVISAKIESEIAELSDNERVEYLAVAGLEQSGLDRLIQAGYAALNLITFFTAGPQEARAWTVTAGSTAPQAAGRIHTDFEKGFIRADICNWQDFVEHGEAGCRQRGLMRTEGKTYIMQDGDVCHFHHAPVK